MKQRQQFVRGFQPVSVIGALVVMAALGALAAACGDETQGATCEPATEPELLVDHSLWQVTSSADDPFSAFRPGDDISCPPTAREIEDLSGQLTYSIETGACPYSTMEQALQVDLCAGDELLVWLWHFELTAPLDATAHLALQIGDERVWERSLSIPSESGLFIDTVTMPTAAPAGTPIFFHVRNHGANSYNLIEFRREGPPSDE